MTTYNNVLGVFSYAAHTLANTLWSERAFNIQNLLLATYQLYLRSFQLLNIEQLYLRNKDTQQILWVTKTCFVMQDRGITERLI